MAEMPSPKRIRAKISSKLSGKSAAVKEAIPMQWRAQSEGG